MAFQIVLVNHTPPTASDDVDAVASSLLRDIGYLPRGLEVPSQSSRRRRGRPRGGGVPTRRSADPPRPGEEVLRSVPYRLVMDCFLREPCRGFSVEELVDTLGASKPTVYRHLLKLRELDLLSMGDENEEGAHRRTYGVRFGRPSRAWRFVEVGAECALYHIRELVDLVWAEAEADRRKEAGDGGLKLDLTSSRISFRLPLTEMGPPARDVNAGTHLTELLKTVGYLTPWSLKGDEADTEQGLAHRLFKECLLDRPSRTWTMRELMAVLDTSKPTLYRNLKKLEALDLMERGLRGESPRSSKAFRIRYGDLSKAWNFTEEHARQSLRAYRETVEHLEALLEEVR